jgi:putative redox protein
VGNVTVFSRLDVVCLSLLLEQVMTQFSIHAQTENIGSVRQRIDIATHTIAADLSVVGGGLDTAPDPHGLFDASLVACKALTAHWYAQQRNFPLERVTSSLERDDSQERQGKYVLTVKLTFHGPLTDEQRAKLLDVTTRCPVHKLMTNVEVTINTLMGEIPPNQP